VCAGSHINRSAQPTHKRRATRNPSSPSAIGVNVEVSSEDCEPAMTCKTEQRVGVLWP